MNQNLYHILAQLGLSDIAIKIYLQLQTNPELNITQIALNLGTYRRKVYECLKELEEIGLLEKSGEYIHLKSPSVVNTLLKSKQYELNKSLVDYEEILPQLLTHFFHENKTPAIRVFDGTNKFRYLFNTILDEIDPNDEILSYNEGNDFYGIVDSDYFFNYWVEKRVKKGIHIKILANGDNSMFEQELPKNKIKNRQTKKLSNNSITKSSYWLIGPKIILWDTLTPKAVLVENQVLAQMLREQFEIVWGTV